METDVLTRMKYNQAIAAAPVPVQAAAWLLLLVILFFENCDAAMSSDWREQHAELARVGAGGACTGAEVTALFDVDEHICVIQVNPELSAQAHAAGPVRCFGEHYPLVLPKALEEVAFTHVSVGANHACAIRAADEALDRRPACWGNNNGDRFQQISRTPNIALQSICSGSYYSCGVRLGEEADDDTGRVVCWGESEFVQSVMEGAKGRRVEELACGQFAVCAVLAESALAECWGDEELNEALQHVQHTHDLHRLTLRNLTIGLDHACALRVLAPSPHHVPLAPAARPDVHKGVCWGSNWQNVDLLEATTHAADIRPAFVGKAVERAGKIVDISAGSEHTCSITQGGQLQCWGLQMHDAGVPTGNHWMAVKAGNMRTCAGNQFNCFTSTNVQILTPEARNAQ